MRFIKAHYPSVESAMDVIKEIKLAPGGVDTPTPTYSPYVYVDFKLKDAGFATSDSLVGSTGVEVTWEQFKQALGG